MVDFTVKQSMACIFPVAIFLALAVTQYVRIGVYRYDLMLLICLLVQALMLISKLETWDELKVISMFHLFGLGLEIFKVHHGSWSYPEAALSKVMDVPLYSGFLYASVGSFMCQSWRRLDIHLMDWPDRWYVWWLAAAIYANFFSEHYTADLRVVLMALVLLVFRDTRVRYTVAADKRTMPLSLSFLLIGFFIWIAENISTVLHGYQYPSQVQAWTMVYTSKITSWFLLVIISFICVAWLKHYKARLSLPYVGGYPLEGPVHSAVRVPKWEPHGN